MYVIICIIEIIDCGGRTNHIFSTVIFQQKMSMFNKKNELQ